MMSEIVEMTMAIPGSMSSAGQPYFPWSPEYIEGLPEIERTLYLKTLRTQRKAWSQALEDSRKK